MSFSVLIPARLASTRLPRKPLADIAGLPMVVRVAQRAAQSAARQVVVAADHADIVDACAAHGVHALLTRSDHATGSDRLAEACALLGLADSAIVVNVQGDEPLISPLCIAQTARLLGWHPEATIATLTSPLTDEAEFRDPNFAKVVTDQNGWALYFSRAPIPWPRDGGMPMVRRHIGLYAYRAGGLKAINAAPPCALEETEKLEQLRALWLGFRIIVADAVEPPSPAVDTEQDLAKIRAFLERTQRPRR
jgi:3-deoxy-manno-octulosonate cytidylyltransferase (CMP-KDO synthetase)